MPDNKMPEATLLYHRTGEPALILIGYDDDEVEEYVRGRRAVGTGDFGTIKVPYTIKVE